MKRSLIILTVLGLMLTVILTACGDGKEAGTYTITPASTAATVTSTPNPSGSVKVGVETAWSGPLGASGFLGDQVLAMVNKKVKDQGGILGGRELKFIKHDTGGTVAGAVAGATKLVKEDDACALVWGGASAADVNAISSAAEDLKVLYVPFSSPPPGRLENELKYTVLPAPSSVATWENKADVIINKLKPKTLAFLYNEDTALDLQIDLTKEKTGPAGIKTIYTALVPNDVMDMTPYLTKIKFENPDVLVLGLFAPQAITAAKQITELGGWGGIQVIGVPSLLEAAKLPGSWGWIMETGWSQASTYPASVKFTEDFKAANGGKAPTINNMWFYTPLLTIVEAIEQSGTDDRAELARFARSGNLQFDTPVGMAHFTPDGNSGLNYSFIRILEGGKTAPFD